ncbi:WXG100 family type VII secretion target [Streptomyces syringium]|uniref:WXG100 family type VII secretion target n=1 Tax=Streptomyces syringium TaxID=76729 RepID=UPI003445DFB4
MEITYEGVINASESVKKSATTMAQRLGDLQAQVKNVVDDWDGEAKEAFYARQRGWDATAQDLTQTLQKIGDLLREATHSYQAVDKKNAGRF